MKAIGLIGGMSWESTTHYYQRINTLVAQRRSAPMTGTQPAASSRTRRGGWSGPAPKAS